MPERKTREVTTKNEQGKEQKELRAAPKRAGSTAKPAASGRYSTQLKKAP
jgi:hypothetical protein